MPYRMLAHLYPCFMRNYSNFGRATGPARGILQPRADPLRCCLPSRGYGLGLTLSQNAQL